MLFVTRGYKQKLTQLAATKCKQTPSIGRVKFSFSFFLFNEVTWSKYILLSVENL